MGLYCNYPSPETESSPTIHSFTCTYASIHVVVMVSTSKWSAREKPVVQQCAWTLWLKLGAAPASLTPGDMSGWGVFLSCASWRCGMIGTSAPAALRFHALVQLEFSTLCVPGLFSVHRLGRNSFEAAAAPSALAGISRRTGPRFWTIARNVTLQVGVPPEHFGKNWAPLQSAMRRTSPWPTTNLRGPERLRFLKQCLMIRDLNDVGIPRYDGLA